jgi:5-methylcytosine-specific restriction endonuclease McrA
MSYVRTPEIREKNSIANRGRVKSPETLAKISATSKGRIVTRETREKISKALTGRPQNPESVAKSAASRRGLPMSEKVRIALRASRLGHKDSPETKAKKSLRLRGEGNPNWKGGVTPANSLIRWNREYECWRTTVFVRDDYVCQKCAAHSEKGHAVVLIAHHMDCFADFPEQRLDADNGITFCKKCHNEFHDRYGKLHNREWQTGEFLSIGTRED